MRKVIMLLCVFLLSSGVAFARSTAKVTVVVVDELGEIIPNARVNVSFTLPSEQGLFHSLSSFRVKGKTNSNGEFTASNETIGRLGISIDKEGYYQSGKSYEFKSEARLLNRWEPWNPIVEVTLKKKRNPVAMYAKATGWLKIPRLNTPIGYDLEKGDWVSPYGQGFTSDLVIKCDYEKRAYTDYKTNITINFPNEKDGIQEFYFNEQDESSYRWPFEAPEKGYIKTIHLYEESTPDTHETNKKKNVNYIFRIRTKLDDEGNIIEAKYGKIEGEFGVSGDSTRVIYWYNPSGTRNLEFNPEKNLVKWSSRRDKQKHRIKSP